MKRPSAADLIACFQDTLNFALAGELARETERAGASSTVYQEGTVSSRLHALWETEIRVESCASFTAAKRYASDGRVAVLNFANPHYPGGGVKNGAMAQEECLCRSSNLYPCLDREPVLTDFYRYHRENTDYFFSDRLIYTRDVTVFKDDSLLPKYLPRAEWFRVDVITCAAPYLAKRKYTNKVALKQMFMSRIRNVLEAAIDNGAEVLILGAFGCGAFKNPPEIVAAAFREVLREERYRAAFRKVIFAIKRTVDASSVCPNLSAFEMVFFGASQEMAKLRLADSGEPDPAIILPGGRVLKSGEESRAYHAWRRRNPYFGKQFSVLGDSISTLEGFNPKGYNVFYRGQNSEKSGVHEMNDTWWGQVIDYFGGELLVNNAWSGSRVSCASHHEAAFPAGCSEKRTGNLHICSVMPDVIIVNLGINDWANGVPVSDPDDDDVLSHTEFGCAYFRMIEQIRRNYPQAEIWCCTLNQTYISAKPQFSFPEAYGGIHIDRYNEVIRNTAAHFENVEALDLAGIGLAYDSMDGTHPTKNGMDTLAMLMIRCAADREGASFLDCPDGAHDLTVQQVCRRCGCTDFRPDMADTRFFMIGEERETERLAWHILRLYHKQQDREIALQGDQVFAGRSPDCDLQLTSPYAARYQAAFIWDGLQWYLRDNDSRNGTFVNGVRLQKGEMVCLQRGDSISFARKEEVEVL